MQTDRVIKLLLGVIAVLLATLVVQLAFHSPSTAQAALDIGGSSKVYDVRVVGQLPLADVEEIVPLPADNATGINFVARTDDGLIVFRCDYFPKNP